jgi:hypothetical protein
MRPDVQGVSVEGHRNEAGQRKQPTGRHQKVRNNHQAFPELSERRPLIDGS